MGRFLELEFLRKRATGRNVLIAFGVALVLVILLTDVFAAPIRATTGFDPFDLQFPFSRETAAIQLGAYDPATEDAYAIFTVVDYVLCIATALFVALFWAWMFARTPNRMYDLLAKNGVLLLPFLPMLFDIFENICFALIIFRRMDLTSGIVEVAVFAHNAKMTLLTVDNAMSVVFLTMSGVLWLQAWRNRARPG